MECVLRDLSATDAPALAALRVRTFRETHTPHDGGPSVALRLQQWTDLLSATDGERFVVGLDASDTRLVGFAAGCPHAGGVPGYQGEQVVPLLCPACGGEMKIISFITLPTTARRILLHLDLPHRPPRLSPARGPPQAVLHLDQTPASDLAAPDTVPEFEFDESSPQGWEI